MIAPRPSGADRWAPPGGCTGAHKVTGRYPDKSGPAAIEGTRLHALSERLLKGQRVPPLTPDDAAMVMPYVDDVMHEHAAREGSELLVEEPLQGKDGLELLKGTPDARLLDHAAKLCVIWDYKSGRRLVEARENPQLLCYGLIGCPPGYSLELRIVQPAVWHRDGIVRKWRVSWHDAQPHLQWVYQAFRECIGLGAKLRPGGHCLYCPAVVHCEAARDVSLRAVEYWPDREQADLPVEELARELEMMREACTIMAIRKDALEETIGVQLRAGQSVRGAYFKPAKGGRHVWANDTVAAETLYLLTGVDPHAPKLQTPAQLKKAGLSAEIIDGLTEYRPHKTTIATDGQGLAGRMIDEMEETDA